MKMKFFVFVITLSLLLSVMLVAVGGEVAEKKKSVGEEIEENDREDVSLDSESLTQEDPVEIHNWYDLNNTRENLTDDYILMSDLDENTAGYDELVNIPDGWNPIGNETDSFNGTFDGNGHQISDLYIDRPETYTVGLFKAIADGAKVTDVGLVDANVSGNDVVGGLVGGSRGTVSNSFATGDVSGSNAVGGLVGYNLEGIVEDSYATGDVSGDNFIGGLVGGNYYGTVENSYSIGNVDGNEDIGGLVGRNYEGTVEDSYWDTETSGMDESDGGTGKATAEMKNVATYTDTATEGLDESWDFVGDPNDDEDDEDIWDIDEDEVINDGYPFFVWDHYHTLDLTIEGEGTVEIDPDEEDYRTGTEVELIANPDEDWEFVEWTGDESGTSSTITVTMDEDKEITAHFEEEEEEVNDEVIDEIREIPGFTTMILLIAVVTAVAIYRKKKR